jgi:hypothetical protein
MSKSKIFNDNVNINWYMPIGRRSTNCIVAGVDSFFFTLALPIPIIENKSYIDYMLVKLHWTFLYIYIYM